MVVRIIHIGALLFVLLSCSMQARASAADSDRFEVLNRKVFYFNRLLDSLYIKPATVGYETVVPYSARRSVSSFVANVASVPIFVNSVLQGKIPQAFTTSLRIAINSTLGILGLFDVATELGIERKHEDFGKTLYAWGWRESDYLVLPLFGPSTVRDAAGLAGNFMFSVATYLDPRPRNQYWALSIIDRRSAANEFTDLVSTAGVNSYELVRHSYLQHRSYQLSDGKQQIKSQANDELLGEPPL